MPPKKLIQPKIKSLFPKVTSEVHNLNINADILQSQLDANAADKRKREQIEQLKRDRLKDLRHQEAPATTSTIILNDNGLERPNIGTEHI